MSDFSIHTCFFMVTLGIKLFWKLQSTSLIVLTLLRVIISHLFFNKTVVEVPYFALNKSADSFKNYSHLIHEMAIFFCHRFT